MIKINLLESITDMPTGAAMMEERVASAGIQTLLLALTVVGLLVLGAGYDFASSRSAHAKAQSELEVQQRINREMLAVNKEQEELQSKTRDIQVRIDAIQKLRASQQGPGSVLRELNDRFNSVPGLYLRSVQQKGSEIVIKGESPNEASVTRFGQSLEFSSGLFTDLNIETVREVAKSDEKKNGAPTGPESPAGVSSESEAPKPEVVTFTVKCNYAGAKGTQASSTNPAPPNQVAKLN
jgi:Tfp pilus assembly protein PilN